MNLPALVSTHDIFPQKITPESANDLPRPTFNTKPDLNGRPYKPSYPVDISKQQKQQLAYMQYLDLFSDTPLDTDTSNWDPQAVLQHRIIKSHDKGKPVRALCVQV